MIKLGLIGKDISHSKSKAVYEEILNTKIDYTLFDYKSEDDLPTLDELFALVQGISITAPYKKAYSNDVELSGEVADLGIINCIKKEGRKFFATNTDYLAIKDFFNSYENLEDHKIVLLGDGSMATVTKFFLDSKNYDYVQLSRKLTDNFGLLDLTKISTEKLLVINSCGRGYSYSGPISDSNTFWDFNYGHESHINRFKDSSTRYIDGMDLLKNQAIHALDFWSINH